MTDLIFCNATEWSHCKLITLTYADAMIDNIKVYENGKMFSQILQCYLNKGEEIFDSQNSFKCITADAPQGQNHNNSWHLHMIMQSILQTEGQ